MLEPQIIANLLQQVCVSGDFMNYGPYCVHLNVVAIALAQRESHGDQDYSEGDKLD